MKKVAFFVIEFVTLVLLISCNKENSGKMLPTVDFTFTGGNCNSACQVNFSNQSTNATEYLWNFGDGTNSTEKNPTKIYNLAGIYTVTLTATSVAGSASTSKQIIIGLPKPIVALNKLYDTIGLPTNIPRSITISNVGPPGSILDYLVTDNDGYLDIQNPTGSLPSGSSTTFSVLVKPNFVPGYWDGNGNFWGQTTSITVRTPQASNYTTVPVFITVKEADTYMMADVNGNKWHYCTPSELYSFVANGYTNIGRNGGYTCDNNVDVIALEIYNLNGTGTYSLTPPNHQGYGWFKPPTTVLNWGTYPTGSGTVTVTRFDALYIAGRFNFTAVYQGNTANISNGFFKVRRL